MDDQLFTIIGAGIAGLTLANFFEKQGQPYVIYEAAEKLTGVGAGIIISPNGTQVLRKLGLEKVMAKAGLRMDGFSITNGQLKALSTIQIAKLREKFAAAYAIHRGKLQGILLSQIPAQKLRLGKRLSSFDHDQHTLSFTDGTLVKVEGPIIAADGLNSIIRKSLFPSSKIRLTNQFCWRGVCPHKFAPLDLLVAREAWHDRKRFGMVALDHETAYWYAVATFAKTSEEFDQPLSTYFENFAPIVKQLIDKTPQETIITNVLSDIIPPTNWYRGQTVLIGDAAHAMTPNLGQGANQGIEDAFVLQHCLSSQKSYALAFEQFGKIRKKKVLGLHKKSWQVGQLGHLSSRVMVSLVKFGMWATPDGIVTAQNKPICTLEV